MNYEEFLKRKAVSVPKCGFNPSLEINPKHYPFQRDIDRWAIRRGRAAVFADCGLGKTPMQCEIARHVQAHTGGKFLLLAPLAVVPQTVKEAHKFGMEVRPAAQQSDCDSKGCFITNYQKLHHFDASKFDGISADENVFKAMDGKTKKDLCTRFKNVPYRFGFTATPAPNDYEELGNHAEYLGIMSRTEMLATWFQHDGGETSKWRIKGHAKKDFWRWVCSWAVCVRKPSDLGYEDGAFILPELRIIEHVIDSKPRGYLFAMEAQTLSERREARRDSIEDRIRITREIVMAESDEAWLIWCNLNEEGDRLEREIPDMAQVAGKNEDDEKVSILNGFAEGRIKRMTTKSQIAGYGLNYQCCARMVVFPNDSYEQFYQLIRRCWRYGQTRRVDVHIVLSQAEGAILTNLKRKHTDHEIMAAGMLEAMREQQRDEVRGAIRETESYKPQMEMTIPTWLRAS